MQAILLELLRIFECIVVETNMRTRIIGVFEPFELFAALRHSGLSSDFSPGGGGGCVAISRRVAPSHRVALSP